MRCVIQRVTEASVEIDGKVYSSIGSGLLVLAGICKGDSGDLLKACARKIVDLRIFSDENEKMNLSVRDVDGELLVISQFTLCTENEKSGNRPSFTNAEEPTAANKLYELFVNELKQYYIENKIMTGVFAAKMKVRLLNDGPVTIVMEKSDAK